MTRSLQTGVSHRQNRRALARRVVVSTTLTALALVAAIMPAQAVAANTGVVSTVTEIRPDTLRIAEEVNHLIVFVNKSRADLCTPERVAFELAFIEWANTDPQTDPPPAEPATSREGVKPVRTTISTAGETTIVTNLGRNLPVEVWHLEDSVDGTDCTGTDGPGAALFATGAMTWRAISINAPQLNLSDVSVDGNIHATTGQRYHYLVRYQFRQVGDNEGVITPTVRLTPTR